MKKKIVMNRDRVFSIGMAVVSLLVMAATTQIKPTFNAVSGSDPGSKAFPFAVAVLLLLSSIGKFITCGKPDERPFVAGREGWLKIAAVVGLLLAYTFLLQSMGFLLCTFLGTALLLLLMRGDRPIRPVTYVLYPGLLTAVLYLLFHTVLQVILPVGLLWKSILP